MGMPLLEPVDHLPVVVPRFHERRILWYGAEGTDPMAGALRGWSVMCPQIAGLRNEGRGRAVWLARGGCLLWEPVLEGFHGGRADGWSGVPAFRGAPCRGEELHEMGMPLLELVDHLPVVVPRFHER